MLTRIYNKTQKNEVLIRSYPKMSHIFFKWMYFCISVFCAASKKGTLWQSQELEWYYMVVVGIHLMLAMSMYICQITFGYDGITHSPYSRLQLVHLYCYQMIILYTKNWPFYKIYFDVQHFLSVPKDMVLQ